MTPIRFAVLLLAAVPMFASIEVNTDANMDVASERVHERRADREEALYDDATVALDDHDWQRAAQLFRRVADEKMEHADAALYWLAYADDKRAFRSEALAAIAELRQKYPKSRWNEDARDLEIEIRQSAGQQYAFAFTTDDSAKLIALTGLMERDPDEAVRIGDEILRSATEANVKDKVLFVFTQSGDPRAISIVTKAAKDRKSPEVQRRAVRYLGMVPSEATKKALNEVYATTNDIVVRRAVVKAYLVSGDRTRLVSLARTEPNTELRAEALAELGALGARSELLEIAKTEKNVELRAAAIRSLGIAGVSAESIAAFYKANEEARIRRAVADALFVMGNAAQLRAIAQSEKDAALRADIEQKLKRLSE